MSTRRLPAVLGFAAALVLLLLVAIAPAVLAADPTSDPGPRTVEVDLGAEPLLPYIAALLVTSVALMIVGFVAMQVNRRPTPGARRLGRRAWWTCTACSMVNSADRSTCFSCETPAETTAETSAPTD